MTNIIAFDSETRGLSWFNEDERAFLATWADADGEYQADLSKPRETARFLSAIKRADVLVAHNFSFDCHHVREATGHDILDTPKYRAGKQVLADTDLMSRVLMPEGQRKGEMGGHGLKNLSKVFLRADADGAENHIKEMAKAIGLRTLKQQGAYYEVWRAYPEAMEKYARDDARFTYDLYQKFLSKFTDELRAVYDLEMQVMPILIRAEQRGVRLDPVAVEKLTRWAKRERNRLQKYLIAEFDEQALGGEGSDAALIEALQKIGVPLHRTTPTGQLATNKFALQEFEDDFPQIGALMEHRRMELFLSTYLEPAAGREVIHPTFFQCGAWTGRMSCARPNMQNLPKHGGDKMAREARSMFIPRAGHSFVVADFESIEVRLLAFYLGDQGFRDMIEMGLDPHAWMASNIHGGAMEDYLKGTSGEELRAAAKNSLFAITYGAGKRRIGDMNKITEDEAKRLISTIKGSLPGYYRLNDRIRRKIASCKFNKLDVDTTEIPNGLKSMAIDYIIADFKD